MSSTFSLAENFWFLILLTEKLLEAAKRRLIWHAFFEKKPERQRSREKGNVFIAFRSCFSKAGKPARNITSRLVSFREVKAVWSLDVIQDLFGKERLKTTCFDFRHKGAYN